MKQSCEECKYFIPYRNIETGKRCPRSRMGECRHNKKTSAWYPDKIFVWYYEGQECKSFEKNEKIGKNKKK